MASTTPDLSLLFPCMSHELWKRARRVRWSQADTVPSTLKERCDLWCVDDNAAHRDTGFSAAEITRIASMMAATVMPLHLLEGCRQPPDVGSLLSAALMYLRGWTSTMICGCTTHSQSYVLFCVRIGLRVLVKAAKEFGCGRYPSAEVRQLLMGSAGQEEPWRRITTRVDGMFIEVANNRMARWGHKGKGVNCTVVTDLFGHILFFDVQSGEQHDRTMLNSVLHKFEPWLDNEVMLADNGYAYMQHPHIYALKRPSEVEGDAAEARLQLSAVRMGTEIIHGHMKGRWRAIVKNCRLADPLLLAEAALCLGALKSIWRPSVAPVTRYMLAQPRKCRTSGVPLDYTYEADEALSVLSKAMLK